MRPGGQLTVDVRDLPAELRTREVFFPLLGTLVGRWSGSRVPVIIGLDTASEDQLKAFGAAAASTGSVALFHVVGVTPDAPSAAAAFGGTAPEETHRVTVADLRRALDDLCTRQEGRLGAVCLGTPHFSLTEFLELARLLDGRRVHPATPLYVNTGRFTLRELEARGIATSLTGNGVRIVTDTCTYATPVMGPVDGLVMTNSAKWAWYAPQNIGVDVIFADLGSCVRSAIAGKVITSDLL